MHLTQFLCSALSSLGPPHWNETWDCSPVALERFNFPSLFNDTPYVLVRMFHIYDVWLLNILQWEKVPATLYFPSDYRTWAARNRHLYWEFLGNINLGSVSPGSLCMGSTCHLKENQVGGHSWVRTILSTRAPGWNARERVFEILILMEKVPRPGGFRV